MLQRKFDIVVKNHFPKAMDAKDTSIHYLGLMKNDYDIDISKVLMATSVCSDDLNISSTSLFSILFGPFNMGGLGGFPFTGTTGMGAFAHHVPDNGTAFILYGPHVGITLEGVLGEVSRPRMEKQGHSCGALITVLKKFQDPGYELKIDETDYQLNMLEAMLQSKRKEIINAADPVMAITEAAYQVIDRRIHENIEKQKSEFNVSKLVLLGCIIINTNYGLDDYFDPRNFEIIEIK
ncbi:MAG TPA: hypothetical protein DDY13_09500 [Cytophagales bacterium]|jgi:hypothetical protein|nr:hypothetical protein [Cytophagales bacterium]